jgi:putative component of toxin-antitoxin plasmid stabilization module
MGKALGDGLFEFRLREEIRDQGVTEKILLRVFFHAYGSKIILLLGGYDKGEHPSPRRQQREIEAARRYLRDFKERQRRIGP